jgi:DNA-binding CsgD family transcriptional regulator/prefoldin subunit 5
MRFLFIFFLFILPLTVIAQPVWLLHKPYADKYYYADSLYRNFRGIDLKDFIDKTEKIKQWALDNKDLELGSELTSIQYKTLLNQPGSSSHDFETELKQLQQYAVANNLSYFHANVLELLAFYYWNKSKNHSLAFENYITAHNLYMGFPDEAFPQKREYIYTLGTAYYIYEDYDKAIKYLKEALATKPGKINSIIYPLYNTLGLCYRNLGNYDTSDWYFRKIYADSNKEWKSIAGGNIGINYYFQKKYDEAIPLLEQDIRNSLEHNVDIRNAANSLYILSLIYYSRNDLDLSEKLLLQALNISEKKPFWPDYQLADHIYSQLHKIYAVKNDPRLANLYADSALTAKDSSFAEYNSLKLAKAQEKTDYIQYKLNEEQLLNQKKIQDMVRNCLFACIFLLLVIGILFISRQRLMQKHLEVEKKETQIDLITASWKVKNYMESVVEKNILIEHITNELELVKKGEEEQMDNELISRLERAVLLTDEQWEDFRVSFEKVHKGFFGGLKKKYPDLTHAEIRFLALTKMSLSSKEMGAMLGISANAIRMNRYRLRKKLGLDKDDMIEELVNNL